MLTLKQLVDEAYRHEKRREEKGEIEEATFKSTRTRWQNCNEYLFWTSQTKVKAKEVNYKFIDEYKTWLILDKNAGSAHVAKHIADIKRILDKAELYEEIPKNKVSKYVCKRKMKVIENHIEMKEVEGIENYHFSPVTQRYAYLFLFVCYTGLTHVDTKGFDPKKKIRIIEGKKWIVMKRQKSGEAARYFYLPLFPEAERILEKLDGKLPTSSLDTYNDHLERISTICDTSVKITSHSGRKTFFIFCKERYGFTDEAISYMLGHTDIKTTRTHYGRTRMYDVKREYNLRLIA